MSMGTALNGIIVPPCGFLMTYNGRVRYSPLHPPHLTLTVIDGFQNLGRLTELLSHLVRPTGDAAQVSHFDSQC